MNLWRYIQSKSSEVKAQYAFLGASVLTGIIALMWISTVPSRFSDVTAMEEPKEDESGQFAELLDAAKTQLGNVIDASEEATNLGSLGKLENQDNIPNTEVEDSLIDSVLTEENSHQESEVIIKEESILTPTRNDAPRIILIGTTTQESD